MSTYTELFTSGDPIDNLYTWRPDDPEGDWGTDGGRER
jgi:hypothetical protein